MAAASLSVDSAAVWCSSSSPRSQSSVWEPVVRPRPSTQTTKYDDTAQSVCVVDLYSAAQSLTYHLLLLHPFNGLISRTTWVSWHQKGKPFWILLEQQIVGWHQLDHMQIMCTSLHTDNHASTSPLSFYRPDALPAAQPTASIHWRQLCTGIRKMDAVKLVCDLKD